MPSPVYVNVYDLSQGQARNYVGVSSDIVPLTGVVVHGQEYIYLDSICAVNPEQVMHMEGGANDSARRWTKPSEVIHLGTTTWTEAGIMTYLASISPRYTPQKQSLLFLNSNHFANELVKWLTADAEQLPSRIVGGTVAALSASSGPALQLALEYAHGELAASHATDQLFATGHLLDVVHATAATEERLCCCFSNPECEPTPLPPLQAADGDAPLVSVLSPTSGGRHWAHAAMYNSFVHQSYPSLEFLVLDTGTEPSPFFSHCRDPRVKYTHVPFHGGLSVVAALDSLHVLARPATRPAPQASPRDRAAWFKAWSPTLEALEALERTEAALRARNIDTGMACNSGAAHVDCTVAVFRAVKTGFSLGTKRNWLAANAQGSVHANFDDDDVYLPSYIERMVGALRESGAELVKLGTFIEFDARTDAVLRLGSCSFDPRPLLPNKVSPPSLTMMHPSSVSHGERWGYGFSYVHTARLAWRVPYEPINFGEDYAKLCTAAGRNRGTEFFDDVDTCGPDELGPCVCFADVLGDAVAIHVAHKTNTSRVMCLVPLLNTKEVPPAHFDALFAHPCRHLVEAAMAAQAPGTGFADPLCGLFLCSCGCVDARGCRSGQSEREGARARFRDRIGVAGRARGGRDGNDGPMDGPDTRGQRAGLGKG
jgi:hypothetical protein